MRLADCLHFRHPVSKVFLMHRVPVVLKVMAVTGRLLLKLLGHLLFFKRLECWGEEIFTNREANGHLPDFLRASPVPLNQLVVVSNTPPFMWTLRRELEILDTTLVRI